MLFIGTLWGVVGNYGSGKSLYLCIEGFDSTRQILGNFSLNLDNYEFIKSPYELKEKGFNRLVLLDEFQLWLSAYLSTSLVNRQIHNIIDMCRHRDIDLFAGTRRLHRLDSVFRDTLDYVVYCKREGKRDFPYSYKNDKRDFRYVIIDKSDNSKRIFHLPYEKAELYFPFFDSFELFQPLMEEQLDLDVLERTDGIKYLKVLEGISRDIMKTLKKLTHANIQREVSKMGLYLKERHTRKLYSIIEENLQIQTPEKIKKKPNKIKDYVNEMQFL